MWHFAPLAKLTLANFSEDASYSSTTKEVQVWPNILRDFKGGSFQMSGFVKAPIVYLLPYMLEEGNTQPGTQVPGITF